MNNITKRKKEQELNKKLETMPIFINDYFRRIKFTSIQTRMFYYYDLNLFLTFLTKNISEFKNKKIKELTYQDLNKITLEHIDKFLNHITYYKRKVKIKNKDKYITISRQNNEYGINRKIACFKSFFGNLYEISLSKDKNDPNKLEKNISPLIKLNQPKLKEKYRMNYEAIEEFLIAIKNGKGKEGEFSDNQLNYIRNNTLNRDLCIVSLLAETGIRVGELIGINIYDIDFNNKKIKITRKGGKEEFVYYNFSELYIQTYYKERKEIVPIKGHESAFFLSIQKKRMTTRAIQLMIEKYAKLYTNIKITPHTFRRSFATNMYNETKDIYLVASLIGDTVNVTTKHYAKQNEESKREAVNNYLQGKINLKDDIE